MLRNRQLSRGICQSILILGLFAYCDLWGYNSAQGQNPTVMLWQQAKSYINNVPSNPGQEVFVNDVIKAEIEIAVAVPPGNTPADDFIWVYWAIMDEDEDEVLVDSSTSGLASPNSVLTDTLQYTVTDASIEYTVDVIVISRNGVMSWINWLASQLRWN